MEDFKKLLHDLNKLESLTKKKLATIREMQSLLQKKLGAPRRVLTEQEELFPGTPKKKTLSQDIYNTLYASFSEDFSAIALAQLLHHSIQYGRIKFQTFLTQIRTALRYMRRDTAKWPEMVWHSTPRIGGGTVYRYHWRRDP